MSRAPVLYVDIDVKYARETFKYRRVKADGSEVQGTFDVRVSWQRSGRQENPFAFLKDDYQHCELQRIQRDRNAQPRELALGEFNFSHMDARRQHEADAAKQEGRLPRPLNILATELMTKEEVRRRLEDQDPEVKDPGSALTAAVDFPGLLKRIGKCGIQAQFGIDGTVLHQLALKEDGTLVYLSLKKADTARLLWLSCVRFSNPYSGGDEQTAAVMLRFFKSAWWVQEVGDTVHVALVGGKYEAYRMQEAVDAAGYERVDADQEAVPFSWKWIEYGYTHRESSGARYDGVGGHSFEFTFRKLPVDQLGFLRAQPARQTGAAASAAAAKPHK